MKLTLEKLFLTFLLVLLITGCRKNYSISDKQSILFQFDYVNYAWGIQHNGYIIDNKGNILVYNDPEDWNFPDNDLILDADQVAENISKCTVTSLKIPGDELHKYTNYIENIASSKVTALKNVAADAGTTEFICYQFSESNKIYRGYLIKMDGDFTCENLNFFSKKVVTWMRNISDSLPEK